MNEKIFNVREAKCERDRFDTNLRCEFESDKGRVTHTERDIDHAFIIKKPSKKGDNLIASGYANEHTASIGFFGKKCAVVRVKPIKDVEEKEILIPSRKEVICADSKSVLVKFIEGSRAGPFE